MRRLSGGSHRRRRSGPSRLRGRKRWIVAALGLVAVLGAWTALNLWTARRDLLRSRQDLSAAASQLATATDQDAAGSLLDATRRAESRTASAQRSIDRAPMLWVAQFVPVINTQRNGLVRATRKAHAAAVAVKGLAHTAAAEAEKLTVRNGAVNLGAVHRLGDAVDEAATQLDLTDVHSDAQWGPLGKATRELDSLVSDTRQRLANGAGVMRAVGGLLGDGGNRRVFIALLNNAEMRDQGMVLSYAVADTSGGGFRLARSGSVLDIPVAHAVTEPKLPSGTQTIFGALQPNHVWQSVNATADTSLSGALVRSMYEEATGDRVDGVVAIDVPALAGLLSVTGPVTVPGIAQPIGADNASQVLLNDLYAASSSFRDPYRLEQVGATLDAVVAKIQSGSLNSAAVVRALGTAAEGGHTWVTSADPDAQRALERAGLSGSPGRVHPTRTLHLSVQNGTATKLDYFVDPSVDVRVAVNADDSAIVTTTVTLPNAAPVPTPPGEQFGPDGFVTNTAGLYRGRVYFWGPAGGDQLDSVAESGLRLSFAVADVPAGGTGKLTFTTVVPNAVRHGRLELRFVPQPRVRPMHLDVHVTAVGRKVRTPRVSADWDRTLDLAWMLSH